MKRLVFISLICFSFAASARDVRLNDYQWNITDIATRGLKRDVLYKKMDRDFVKVKKSICSNRAHMWANDFKTKHRLDTAKIFIFYTKLEKPPVFAKSWWYHVAPVVNENGALWVMDPAFGGKEYRPLTKEEWFKEVSIYKTCREIQGNETELIELMFTGRQFPKDTSYGNHDCHYKIVPHTIWTPRVLAQNLLGKDEEGKPVRVERPEILKSELFEACLEATTSKIGWAFGNTKKKCEEYVY